MFVQYSKRESERNGQPLFYHKESNTWVDFDHATMYVEKEQTAPGGIWMTIQNASVLISDFESGDDSDDDY